MNKIKTIFKNPSYKTLRWFMVFAFVILIWQAYSNLTNNAMLHSYEGKTWSANGPGYHK